MRLKQVSVAFAVLFLLCMALLLYFLVRSEERNRIKEVEDRGTYLVSLVSLYSIDDFKADNRHFLLKSIAEYTANTGLIYLYVHDSGGKQIMSLDSTNISESIPPEIQTRSLASQGFVRQSFRPGGSGETAHEFAKPVLEKGSRTGTVRIGLRPLPVQLFSLERVSFLSMIAFFIFAALVLFYYGVIAALKPLKDVHSSLKNAVESGAFPADAPKGGQFLPVVEELKKSLTQVKSKLGSIGEENISLASRLGVIQFEKKLQSKILDAIGQGIIVTDLQGHIHLINDSMLKLLGRKSEEVLDSPVEKVLDRDDIRPLFTEDSGRVRDSIEVTFPDASPGEVFQASSSDLLDGDRTVIARLFMIKNITSRKKSEEVQHDFIAHVAHELRTPLTNIKSYGEMLMIGEITDEEMRKEFYNTINEETNRLTGMIQNILNISKIEMGSLTPNKGLVHTDWFDDGCLTSIDAAARDKQIANERKLPDVFPSLNADKELLKAAIINILGNAIKYTPEKGRITFSIGEVNGYVNFEVTDTGHGISPEDLPHIFEKFYRSGQNSIKEQVGSGLGLAITSEIVRLHGGEIEVHSEPGVGSQFIIRIPKEDYFIARS
ncbi:MAG: ATP-binding protein [Syntrophales bacterium]|nr:ATP-binding protein [Syntrophales bacterium]